MAENNNDKYAPLTGGTMVIGYELAKLFTGAGYNLITVVRKNMNVVNIY